MELYYKINFNIKNIIVGMFKLIIQQYMKLSRGEKYLE